MTVNIVMVEPQIPQNTGNVARTCAVTGARLHLVGPMGFKVDNAKLKRAGLDYWDKLDITFYDDLDDFFAKNDGAFYFFTSKAVHTHSQVRYPDNCYLFFGSETHGLAEDLLFNNEEKCVRIPMVDNVRCLNLSNAVAVGVYEVLRQWDYPELKNNGTLTKFDWNKSENSAQKNTFPHAVYGLSGEEQN